MRPTSILASTLVLLLAACGSGSGNADGDGGVLVDGDGALIDGDGSLIDGDGGLIAPDGGIIIPGGGDACDPDGPQCNNCIDDDGDGRIDGFDPECTGALDNDEASFATGISGDNKSNSGVQDCFFDGNSGGGNDGCYILDCCFDGTCSMQEQQNVGTSNGNAGCIGQTSCIESCQGLAPPGCDCFGCCTVCDPDTPGDCRDILLPKDDDSECTAANLDACTTCVQNDSCGNECDNENCELCPGQTVEDLPPECVEQACPNGQTVCTAQTDCEASEYCSVGCCIPGSIIQ